MGEIDLVEAILQQDQSPRLSFKKQPARYKDSLHATATIGAFYGAEFRVSIGSI